MIGDSREGLRREGAEGDLAAPQRAFPRDALADAAKRQRQMVLAAQETPEVAIAGADHKSFRGVSLGVCAKQFVENRDAAQFAARNSESLLSLQYLPTMS